MSIQTSGYNFICPHQILNDCSARSSVDWWINSLHLPTYTWLTPAFLNKVTRNIQKSPCTAWLGIQIRRGLPRTSKTSSEVAASSFYRLCSFCQRQPHSPGCRLKSKLTAPSTKYFKVSQVPVVCGVKWSQELASLALYSYSSIVCCLRAFLGQQNTRSSYDSLPNPIPVKKNNVIMSRRSPR